MTFIKLPARLESLEELIHFVTAFATKQGLAQKSIQEIRLVIEESLVNIFSYAYPDSRGDVELSCKLQKDRRLVVEIVDAGVPFDIRSTADPDLSAGISERKLGGLGIFIIRKMVHELQYRREKEKNILTLTFQKTAHRQ